ncbi:hypothetical protein [Bacillus sp. JCM 19041]
MDVHYEKRGVGAMNKLVLVMKDEVKKRQLNYGGVKHSMMK